MFYFLCVFWMVYRCICLFCQKLLFYVVLHAIQLSDALYTRLSLFLADLGGPACQLVLIFQLPARNLQRRILCMEVQLHLVIALMWFAQINFTLLTAQQIHFRRILQCILQFPNNNISLYDLFLTRYFFEKIKLVVYIMCLRSLVCHNGR